ncbi:MAG TPA: UDP-N-acetylglucosamine 2-epimerase (non-hydrolyzing) [Nitrososphaeraceae archaeon]
MTKKIKKIISVVGARPNIIKMAPIHNKLNSSKKIISKIVHTGQHYDYEMSEIFFKEFDLPAPHYDLEVGSGTANYQIGKMMSKLEQVIAKEHPDMVLVYGDTNSTLAGALSANKCSVPVGHVEAGLRSFDRNMPEEINRIVTDHLSDYLFAPTRTALFNLQKENIQGRIINTGDISVEIVEKAKGLKSSILAEIGVEKYSYFLLTIHRAENTSSPRILRSLVDMIATLDYSTVVFPIHPRTRKILAELDLLRVLKGFKHLKLILPVGYVDFINLIRNSDRVLTDSGGVQKESYLLGTPCVTLRSSTEWVETIKEGWNNLSAISPETIGKMASKKIERNKSRKKIFGSGKTSDNISKIVIDAIEASN